MLAERKIGVFSLQSSGAKILLKNNFIHLLTLPCYLLFSLASI
jgi:hypothetical protein